METLFVLAGDALVLFLPVAAVLIVEAVLVVLPLLEILIERLIGIAASPEKAKERRDKIAARSRRAKRFAFVTGGVFAVCAGIVLVLNFFFFEPTVRWGL